MGQIKVSKRVRWGFNQEYFITRISCLQEKDLTRFNLIIKCHELIGIPGSSVLHGSESSERSHQCATGLACR